LARLWLLLMMTTWFLVLALVMVRHTKVSTYMIETKKVNVFFSILYLINFCYNTATTHDHEVFNFHADNSSCHGFEEVLACYQKVVPNLSLSGNYDLSLSCFSFCTHIALYAAFASYRLKYVHCFSESKQ
jgi:hypothetical protein